MDAERIIKEFNFNCKNFYKEKSGVICKEYGGGVKRLKKNEFPYTRILFAHEVKERLYERGILTDRFALTAEGLPYKETDDGAYCLCDCPPPRYAEADFADKEIFKAILAAAAKIHSELKNFRPSSLVTAEPVDFDRAEAEFRAWKKYVGKQSRLSDFDVIFLKNQDFFMKSLQFSRLFATERDGLTIAHNALKEETVYAAGAGAVFTSDYCESAADGVSADLASLIKRHVKRSDAPLPLSDALAVYDRVNPLTDSDLKNLRSELYYPDAFIKICKKYYSKKRTWIPGAFLSRVEAVAAGAEKYKKYVDEFAFDKVK